MELIKWIIRTQLNIYTYSVHLINVFQRSIAFVADHYKIRLQLHDNCNEEIIVLFVVERVSDAESPSRLVGAHRMCQLWSITIRPACNNCRIVCVRTVKPQG